MTAEELRIILKKLGVSGAESVSVRAFTSDEDGSEYAVWLVDSGDEKEVLKRAKGHELEVYESFFTDRKPYAPALLGVCEYDGERYFLTEYCPGDDLRVCDRERLVMALDALITAQNEFWGHKELSHAAVGFDMAVKAVTERGKYLGSPLLDEAYARFLEVFERTPLTLCHDDLLPVNVLVGDRAVLIDWECGGMHPYPESIARLIAHGREEKDAFFYLTAADRGFAIEYYYNCLVKKHGIAYDEYIETLDCFLFYEYCEWIMLGNRYGNKGDERYGYYTRLADETARKMLRGRT